MVSSLPWVFGWDFKTLSKILRRTRGAGCRAGGKYIDNYYRFKQWGDR
jgi:hypothetical protein